MLSEYDEIYVMKPKHMTEYKVTVYLKYTKSKIVDLLVVTKGKLLLQQNDTVELLNYKTRLKASNNLDIGISTSKNKEEDTFISIVNENCYPRNYKGVMCTTVMNAGVNINDNITDVFIIGRDLTKNIDNIRQFIARPRGMKQVNRVLLQIV